VSVESNASQGASASLSSQLSTINDHLTLSGQVLGSPNFMSPEQAEGRTQGVGPASDIYSLGALLYHLLTGSHPSRPTRSPRC